MKQTRSYLTTSGVSVFEPEGYVPSLHSPSPIFIEELKYSAPLDDGWNLRPSFRKRLGKNCVTIDTGDADLYGTGEVSGNLRRNGDRQIFWNTENPTGYLHNGKQMYQSHPWVLGVRRNGTAFGVIADTTWKSSLSLKNGIRFSSKGPAFRVVIIEKENPAEVMKTLADLTGKMALPPLWALGNQQCRFSYYPQERAAEIADTLRSHRIPCDVIWLDIHYMDRFKIFTFNPEGFGKPEELNRHLHENGFKTVYMIDPGVKVEKGYFVDDQGVEGDYFVRDRKGKIYHGRVWPGQCHFPDFTMPQVRKWWAGLYRDFLSKGVDGVWNDMNEPSVFVGFGGTMPESNLHRGGDDLPAGPHARYHNIYGELMIRATLEGVKKARPDKRPFVLSRSNFLGGQRYAAMWTGDNYSDYSQMKESVPMCLNIGMSGQPFAGPDIGGFMRDCTPDLLRHWTSSGVYFPFVRNHSAEGTANQEPWVFDTQTEDICRRAIERRYRLLPYIYTLFEEASRSGLPVMRPVFWADFKDTSLRTEQQAFLLGDDLLIIPRWCESPSLPKGNWELFSFEEEDDGYQAYLAIRPGAAIPVTEVFQNTVEYNTLNLTVLVNPDSDGRASGFLYEDEGDGYGYKEGVFARYCLSAESEGNRLTLIVSKAEGELPQPQRRIRIGLVLGGKIHFSEWSEESSVSIEVPSKEPRGTDFSKLKFVSLKNGSISRKFSKADLILFALQGK